MSKYAFSTERMLSLVPTAVRGTGFLALLRRLLAPVTYMHTLFTAYRQGREYRLSHTGQVFSLTEVVCDFCDNDGCYIADGTYIEDVMVPYDDDGELANYQVAVPYNSAVTPAVTVPYAGMGQTEQNDFVIHLPDEVYGDIDEDALRAVTDEYKLAGKQYGIVYDDITVETYSFAWTSIVCALYEPAATAVFTFAWSDQVCVLTGVYTFAWSDYVCVQREIEEPYTFAWSDYVCVQREIEEPYTFAWSDYVCVQAIVEDTTDI